MSSVPLFGGTPGIKYLIKFLCRRHAFMWQLREQHGTYRMYVAVTGCTWQPSRQRHADSITAM